MSSSTLTSKSPAAQSLSRRATSWRSASSASASTIRFSARKRSAFATFTLFLVSKEEKKRAEAVQTQEIGGDQELGCRRSRLFFFSFVDSEREEKASSCDLPWKSIFHEGIQRGKTRARKRKKKETAMNWRVKDFFVLSAILELDTEGKKKRASKQSSSFFLFPIVLSLSLVLSLGNSVSSSFPSSSCLRHGAHHCRSRGASGTTRAGRREKLGIDVAAAAAAAAVGRQTSFNVFVVSRARSLTRKLNLSPQLSKKNCSVKHQARSRGLRGGIRDAGEDFCVLFIARKKRKKEALEISTLLFFFSPSRRKKKRRLT